MEQNLNPDAVTLTKTLCAHLAAARFSDLTAAAQRETRRGVLDWIGCALAGSEFGPRVSLLHGFPERGWTWHRVQRALARSGSRVAGPAGASGADGDRCAVVND